MYFIRLLSFLGLKNAICRYAFSTQSTSYKQYLQFAFVDSKGRRYYNFTDLKNMPLALLEQLNILQLEIESRIKGADLDAWIIACKKIISSGSSTSIADIGYMLGALEERRTLLLDPRLMMETAALLYIREDEDPSAYNKDLHREKFTQFETDKKDVLYDFFVSAGLSRYLPSATFTPDDWQKYLNTQISQIQTFHQLITQTGTSNSESSATPTTTAQP